MKAAYDTDVSQASDDAHVDVPMLPAVPEGLTAEADVGQVKLSWTYPGDNQITGLQVRHAESSAALTDTWRPVDENGPNARTHTELNLTSGTEYTFEVRAVRDDEPGDATRVMATPVPAKPAGFRATAGNTRVTLRWNNPNDPGVSGYQYHYFSGSAPTEIAWMDTSVITGHTVTELTNGIEYTFEVRARAGIVHGDSATATATPRAPTVPPPPRPPTITCPSNKTVTVGAGISVSASASRGSPPYTFLTPSVNPSDLSLTPSTSGSTGTFTGTAPSSPGAYTVTVTVRDAANRTASCPFTVTVVAVPTCSAPGAVTNLSTDPGDTEVDLSWTNPSGTLTDNHVRYAETTMDLPENWTSIGKTTSHTVQGLDICTQYTVEVRAEDDNCPNNSIGAARSATATTTGSAPGDVTGLMGNAGTDHVTLSWTNPSGPITENRVRYKETIASSWLGRAGIGVRTSDTVRGLMPDTEYTFEVLAWNPCGEGGSDSETVMTDDDTPPPPCTNVTITLSHSPSSVEVEVGGTVDVTVSASGGQGTYTYSIPSGLSWVEKKPRTSNQYTVKPPAGTTPGMYNFDVTAWDERRCPGEGSIPVTVVCSDVEIGDIPNFTVTAGQRFSRTATVSGGCGTKSLSIDSGQDWVEHEILPNGDLRIHGTAPEEEGSHDVTVRVSASGGGNPDTEDFTVTVVCPDVVIGAIDDFTVTARRDFSRTATVEGGCGTKSSSIDSGQDWVNHEILANSDLRIHGTAPSAADSHDVTVRVSADGGGNDDTEDFQIEVVGDDCDPFEIGAISDMEVTVGDPINLTASETPSCETVAWSISGAPGTVRINRNTGVISGNVGSVPGEYSVEVTATDSKKKETNDTEDFVITVRCPTLEVGYADVAVAVENTISLSPSASGGCPPISYEMVGTWPEWVTLDTGSGSVGGTAPASEAGNEYTVKVKATDSRDNSVEPDFTITVSCPRLSVASISDVVASRHEAISTVQVSASGGCPPYTYGLSATASTAGLSISSSGAITGTPGAIGSWEITVSVTDDEGGKTSTSFWIKVAEGIVIGPINDMYGELNQAFSEGPVDVTGGVPSYTYSLSGQPSGLEVTGDGEIEGTPSESGDFDVTLTVTDSEGRSEESLFFIFISSGDFNRDGRADAADLKLFNKKLGLGRSDSGYDRRMDLNGDGIINWADMVILTRLIERDAARRSDESGG